MNYNTDGFQARFEYIKKCNELNKKRKEEKEKEEEELEEKIEKNKAISRIEYLSGLNSNDSLVKNGLTSKDIDKSKKNVVGPNNQLLNNQNRKN